MRTLVPLVLALGCATTTVSGTIQVPAAIPLRTFPHIFVASGHESAELQLAETLAVHLRGDDREVQRIGRDELEDLRRRGQIPLASVVVLIELRTNQQTHTRFSTRPETVCGPAGCYTRNRTDAYDVPTLHAQLRVTVHEGPSARVLQRLSRSVTEEGRGWERMEGRVVRALRSVIRDLVDARTERVQVPLLRVDVPSVSRAIEDIGAGRWRDGRVRLERASRSDAVRTLPPQERARVFYNLGIARRFDPVSLEQDIARHFRAAESPLRVAIRLDPDPLYDRALRQLEAHRSQVSVLREQEEAAEHNYRLRGQTGTPADSLPTPPPGYDQ